MEDRALPEDISTGTMEIATPVRKQAEYQDPGMARETDRGFNKYLLPSGAVYVDTAGHRQRILIPSPAYTALIQNEKRQQEQLGKRIAAEPLPADTDISLLPAGAKFIGEDKHVHAVLVPAARYTEMIRQQNTKISLPSHAAEGKSPYRRIADFLNKHLPLPRGRTSDPLPTST